MIKIIETSQRADMKISYSFEGDILTVTIDGVTEEFDFTGLPEGKAEKIESEILPVNPVVSADKVEGEITITLIRFYGFEEKDVFENVENQMEK